MTAVFDHILSLGSDCDVALQLRRTGWLQTPSVFDWLVTPWDAMMNVLEDNGKRLAQQFYLSHDGRGAACEFYNLVYWHEFTRNQHHLVEINDTAAKQTRSKLLHKMARMRAACETDGYVLFIRAGIVTDAPIDRFANGKVFLSSELDRCTKLISTLYPKLRFSLLCIDYAGRDNVDATPPSDTRIIRYNMEMASSGSPAGLSKSTDAAWDKLFMQFNHRSNTLFDPVEEKLFY